MIRATSLLSAVLLAACSGGNEAPAPPASAAVEVAPAALRPMRTLLEAYGTVEFAASDAQTLAVQYEARVARVMVSAGHLVKKGQPLLALAASATSALELDKARRDAEVAAADLARLKRLRESGLATEIEVQTAQSAAGTAKELRDSLTARIGAAHEHVLLAPQDGVVDGLTAAPGDVVPAGTVIARVARADRLRVRLGVEAEDVPAIAAGQKVTISPLYAGATSVAAQIEAIDQRVDAQTRLAAAMVRLPDASGLLPGAPVRAQIEQKASAAALAVPRAAVLYAAEAPYVFVADGKIAHRRAVKTGAEDSGYVEIVEGLKAGEPVIIQGNYELEDGMAIRVGGEAPQATPQ